MKKISLIAILFTITSIPNLNAQPPEPGGDGFEKPNCANPPCVPIDGGLSWLLIAGAAYGAKKISDTRNKDESILG